jgi:hypothetical protein
MDSRYSSIVDRYLAEMRAIRPSIIAWWDAHAVRPVEELEFSSAQNDFERRWPAGPTAHPRVIEIFRRYFLEIDHLNLEIEAQDDEGRTAVESDWGLGADEDDPFQLPIDLLVDDLQSTAPDVYQLVKGMVFVPIGLSPDEEFC